MRLFHGNSNTEISKHIVAAGALQPPPPGQSRAKGFLKPVPGRVYLTPRLDYGIIYALGCDCAGSDASHFVARDGSFGCLFVVDSHALYADVQPDEDSVGELVAHNTFPWLTRRAQLYYGEKTMRRAMSGEYIWWARIGKGLLKHLSPQEKHTLLTSGLVHMSHAGPVPFIEAWVIDKHDSPRLNRDGSNFFALARRAR